MNNIEQKYASFILDEELRIESGEKLTINAKEIVSSFALMVSFSPSMQMKIQFLLHTQ